MRWLARTTFTTTRADDRSPAFHLAAGLIIVEYTCLLRPGWPAPYLNIDVDHTSTGLEYHALIRKHADIPPTSPFVGRHPIRITIPGRYAIGVHADSIASVTVRLLRARA